MQIILAEIGDNVRAFSSSDKLAAWVGLAPGNAESAGKSRYSSTRPGNKYVRSAMIQVAWAAVRTKDSYWRALFAHLCKRMPVKKAIVVIAHKLIRVVYKVLRGTLDYQEYGAEVFIANMQKRYDQKKLRPRLAHAKSGGKSASEFLQKAKE